MAEQIVNAEIGGTVWRIECKEGASVAEGDALIVLESMKMEIPVSAPANGKVVKILVAVGDVVAEGQGVAVIDA